MSLPYPNHPSTRLTEEDLHEEEHHFQQILCSFSSFATHTILQLQKYHRDYDRLPMEHRELIPGYKEKLRKVEEAVRKNQLFYDQVIAAHMDGDEASRGRGGKVSLERDGSTLGIHGLAETVALSQTESENLKSLLRQVMRDWSEEVTHRQHHLSFEMN